MKYSKAILYAMTLLSINANADTLGQPQTPTAPVIEFMPENAPAIPMLSMTFNCGECEQNAKIKALVEGAYLDQAELEKAKVDESKTAELTVTKYRSRGKARFFVGALAGADIITGTLDCNGEAKQVSDTAISAINGIESVARNVGKDAYKAVKECALSQLANITPVGEPVVIQPIETPAVEPLN